tara:strand:- start:188013 stop:188144 length:132 start_codon:yes stop_codon:yes gene_type:complete
MNIGRKIETGACRPQKTIGIANLKVFQIVRIVPDHPTWVVAKQ